MAKGLLGLLAAVPKGAPKGAPPGGMEDGDESGGDEGSPGEMAAADFRAASDKGDDAGMYAAFERMFKACESGAHSEGGPPTDESEDDEDSGY